MQSQVVDKAAKVYGTTRVVRRKEDNRKKNFPYRRKFMREILL